MINLNLTYSPAVESFIYKNKYFTCREKFHSFYKGGGFYFCNGEDDNLAKVISYILAVENKLFGKRWIAGGRTKILLTTMKSMCFVEPGSFWQSCNLRMSLFTLLLRAGINYNGEDNLNLVYDKGLVLANTHKAVEYFLNGNTCYVGWNEITGIFGWGWLFSHKSEEFVKKNLSKRGLNRMLKLIRNILYWTNF